MDTDLALVLGALLALLAVPAAISAFSSDRSGRGALVLAVLGGGLMVYAVMASPGGYSAGEFPQVVMRVIARIFR